MKPRDTSVTGDQYTSVVGNEQSNVTPQSGLFQWR